MIKQEVDLVTKLEEAEFSVTDTTDGIELETWTSNGVNMLIYIDSDTPLRQGILDYIDMFNVDEEVIYHWEMKGFADQFTLTQAIDDFTEYITILKDCLK